MIVIPLNEISSQWLAFINDCWDHIDVYRDIQVGIADYIDHILASYNATQKFNELHFETRGGCYLFQDEMVMMIWHYLYPDFEVAWDNFTQSCIQKWIDDGRRTYSYVEIRYNTLRFEYKGFTRHTAGKFPEISFETEEDAIFFKLKWT